MQLQELVLKISEIAKNAGAEIIKIYESGFDPGIEYKADQSPLTFADLKANEIIMTGLNDLPDNFPVISEESKQADFKTRKKFEYFWLVDPLDGTKEFIRRNGEFTINIALIRQKKAILGVIYAPYFDELYWAAEGLGAYQLRNGKSEKLEVSSFRMTDPGLKILCSRSHMNPKTRDFIGKLNQPNLVSKGSSLKFVAIAKGEAHLYPRLAPTMEWDTAAAQIIVEEAGGQVLNADTNASLSYNKKELVNPDFIARGKISV